MSLLNLAVVEAMAEAPDFSAWLDDNGPRCGECRACCTVHETVSPGWQTCPHECDQGCAIYPERPELCRGYACLWRSGILEGDERRRPDRLGIIFDCSMEPMPHFVAWEVWPGAGVTEEAGYLIGRLARSRPVNVIAFGGTRNEVFGNTP